MKNLIQFSVQKAVTVFMVVIAIGVFGVVSFTRLTTDLFPDINIPFAVVVTSYPGASPDEVERELSVPLENTFQTTSGVIEVSSTSSENMSMISLEFESGADMDSVVLEMREDLNLVLDSLPDDAGNPVIIRINPDLLPIMTFSVTYEGKTLEELTQWVEEDLSPQVERVPGVASLAISGEYNSEMRVMLDQDAIDDFNDSIPSGIDFELDKTYVGDVLKEQNFSFPSGFVTVDGIDYLVRVGDKIDDLETLESLKIVDFGSLSLTLDEIADIEFVPAENKVYSKVNGEDALTLTIQKGSGYATTDVTEEVNKVLANITNDSDAETTMLLDQGEYINASTSGVTDNLLIGGILALAVLFLFLRNLRVTFIVGVAIPISLLFAIILIYLSGITLNIVSLGGLALGIGMLVDNSIVVMENIFRMKKEGASNKEAALHATHQVAGAITASTLTTIGVFLPIMFAEDFIREIFYQLALTVSFSLVASLFIALTLVPAIASKILKDEKSPKKEKKSIFDGLKVGYEKTIKKMFKFRGFILIAVMILFVVSIFLATSKGLEFFPATDEGSLQISIETNPEDPINFDTFSNDLDELYADLSSYDSIDTIGISLGGNNMGFGINSTDSASVNVVLKDDRTMSTTDMQAEIITLLETNYSDYIFEVSGSQGDVSMLVGEGLQIRLTGIELDRMREEALEITELLEGVEGLRDIDPGFGRESKEIKVEVNKDEAVKYISLVDEEPLTVEGVWMMIGGSLQTPETIGSIRFDGNNYDMYVYNETDESEVTLDTVEDLEQTVVGFDPLTQTPVTLNQVATISVEPGFSSITRIDGTRTLTISANYEEGYNPSLVATDVEDAMESYEAPTGYGVDFLGENEEIMNAVNTLVLVGVLAIALVYMIMASQFQSLIYPFIIMITIPLAFTGGFFILYIFDEPVSVVAIIGLIVLAGVVVNNGIVLVDYINQLRQSGYDLEDAITEAGKVRMRPIFMTALTTILALLGLAIGIGEGAELMQPMALTAIGGLVYATFLTIFVVPLMYYSITLKGRYIIGALFTLIAIVTGAFFIIDGVLIYGIIALVGALIFILMMLFMPKAKIEFEQNTTPDEYDPLDAYIKKALK
ncbi:MAG: efflux RND transporter permease subunit [Bacillota bacterium]